MSALLRRLVGVTDTIAYLNAWIRELEQARGLVKKARLSARRARRKPLRKRRAFKNDRGRQPWRPSFVIGRAGGGVSPAAAYFAFAIGDGAS